MFSDCLNAVFKRGKPSNGDLERLANKIIPCWKKLGRALDIDDAKITALERDHSSDITEQAYKMLLHWKQSKGSDANYEVLFEALCDDRVSQRELAEEFCQKT